MLHGPECGSPVRPMQTGDCNRARRPEHRMLVSEKHPDIDIEIHSMSVSGCLGLWLHLTCYMSPGPVCSYPVVHTMQKGSPTCRCSRMLVYRARRPCVNTEGTASRLPTSRCTQCRLAVAWGCGLGFISHLTNYMFQGPARFGQPRCGVQLKGRARRQPDINAEMVMAM
jgi:hypothetical protein